MILKMGYDRTDQKSDEVDEILPPSWNVDNNVPEENWDRLFQGR